MSILKSTVTFLELTPPAKPRMSLPLGHQVSLLRTTKMPLHFYRYLQFRVGKKWHWVSRLRMNDDELAAIIHAEKTQIYVLMVDGAPSGFFEINASHSEKSEIAYFGIMEHATGRGLGRWFLNQAIHTALESKPEKVIVNTCTLDHPAALSLYQKCGFQAVKRQDTEIMPLTDAEMLHLMQLEA